MSVQLIIKTLREQADHYEAMIEIEQEKTPAIVGNDIEKLNLIVQREGKWVKRAEELEQTRILATKQFYAEQGLKMGEGKIAELIRMITHFEEKRILIQLQERLSLALNQLKQVNEHNQVLANQALEFIHFSLDLLIEDPNEGATYEHPSLQASKSRRGSLFNVQG